MGDRLRIGVTGHQGLTNKTEALVADAIARELQTATAVTGVTSLAEGADQIFAEQVLRSKGRLEVVIPTLDYITTFAPRGRMTYEKLLNAATNVVRLEPATSDEAAYWAAGQWIVDHCDRLLAVWNGQKAEGLGGTGDVVRYAQEKGVEVIVVWPEGSSRLG